MSVRAMCLAVTALLAVALTASFAVAQDKPKTDEKPSGGSPSSPPAPPYAQVLKDAKSIPGMLQLHQRGNNLFVELMPGDYGSEYIVLMAISRGIGQGQLLGGMTWS